MGPRFAVIIVADVVAIHRSGIMWLADQSVGGTEKSAFL